MSYFQKTGIAKEIEERYRKLYPLVTGVQKPKPEDQGYVKPGGWGGNVKEPKTWKITKMKDDPKLFKIVDAKGKNIATNFVTKEGAEQFITVAIKLDQEDDDDPTDQTPEQPEQPPTGKVTGPYPAAGADMGHKIRGPTTRHYRSGKPDDETIEANVKNIKDPDHQFIVYVTMHKIEHDDSVSLKFGGTHMDSGWFDTTVFFKDGRTGIGTEEKHPSTDLEIIKGPKLGNILNKRLGVAGVYRANANKVELWTDLGQGWKKQVEGTDVGDFNPKADTFEAQLRIDGFAKGSVPTIHTAVVQPI